MDRKEWSALIARYGRQEALEFYEKNKETLDFDVISGPELGLTMVKMRDHAQNSLFYIGEVLITETKIRNQEDVGVGLIKGEDYEFSLSMAFIDLCFKLNEFQNDLNVLLNKLKKNEKESVKAHTNKILQTKVSFDMMND